MVVMKCTRVLANPITDMTLQQYNLLRLVADAIIEAIAGAGPMGAHSGTIYGALSAEGCTLPQFQQIMAGLVAAGMVTCDGLLYQVTAKGANWGKAAVVESGVVA